MQAGDRDLRQDFFDADDLELNTPAHDMAGGGTESTVPIKNPVAKARRALTESAKTYAGASSDEPSGAKARSSEKPREEKPQVSSESESESDDECAASELEALSGLARSARILRATPLRKQCSSPTPHRWRG